MLRYKITIQSHGFKVRVFFNEDIEILTKFRDSLALYETKFNPRLKKSSRILKLIYSTYMKRSSIYGLPLGMYEEFIKHLKLHRISDKDVEITNVGHKFGKRANLIVSDAVSLRLHQPAIVDFICGPETIKVLPAQTGSGKSMMALYAIGKLQIRTVILMSARHVGTWIKESNWVYTNSETEVVILRGKNDFVNAIEMGLDNTLNCSVMIVTTDTLRNYLTEYEETEESTYGCIPSMLYETLGVGLVIVDEAHENLHFNVRHAIETNVPSVLYLSATIVSLNSFINKIYKLIYPINRRYTGLAWVKFITVKPIAYRFKDISTLRCMGSMGYQHILFEQWIMKDKNRLHNYLTMISNLMYAVYAKEYKPGQKILVYIGMVELIKVFVEFISKEQRWAAYKISAYTEEHDDSVLINNDVIISTVIKSGAGKDIKGLVATLSTVAINAKEKNIQMVGRLRQIDDIYPGVSPTFYYLVCADIPKHIEYHMEKMTILRPFVKEIIPCQSGYVI